MAKIAASVAAGEITPGEAGDLAKFVDAYVRTLEASEFDRRLRVIEAMDGARKVCDAT